ncbi:sulfate transporter [Ophiostoma piceae UAMH 11346]|uniref:Sulfate transporter n=1 Tax=Ophiostoma piceae (strain UAMH 11346) TaxID=1262450 RepID=S3D9L6_OPHP1|nr:sulfate transporter [Ophiostoma piceae UAMH 11346]
MAWSFSVSVSGRFPDSWNKPGHHLAQSYKHSLHVLRNAPLAEISGALGDLGTLLPLMTALTLQRSVSLSSTLVFSGLSNVTTGLWFGIPLPVQPMKAIAAAAIANNASLRDTVAAGALVSFAVLFLAVTGLLRRLADVIPTPVVKGIQLGAGLSLVISAGGNALLGGDLSWIHQPSLLDNRLWAIVAFVGLLVTQRMPNSVSALVREGHDAAASAAASVTGRRTIFLPYALLVFTIGLVLSYFRQTIGNGGHLLPHFWLWHPHLYTPNWLSPNAWAMATAQLPLTTLNSVVAVSALADELFGSDPFPSHLPPSAIKSVTAFGSSVGVMNLVGCWFGAMPVCHGAGGLAAQYRFGARSGASVVMLGAAKVALGLFLGETLVDLLRSFPRSLLGVLVLAAGLELAGAAASLNEGPSTQFSPEEKKERWTVMLMTAACLLAFKNDAVGFLAGLLCHGAYRLADRLESCGSRRRLQRRGHGERQSLLS